jgi:hypothetical protein
VFAEGREDLARDFTIDKLTGEAALDKLMHLQLSGFCCC